MAKSYIWQKSGWPRMYWQESAVCKLLAEVNVLRGQLMGRLSMFDSRERSSSVLDVITQEIVNSSEIEGQLLNRDSVRSSVARQLGLDYDGIPREDHFVEGVVQVMVDAIRRRNQKLTRERLFGWHAALFPLGYSGAYKINVANWRVGDEPMQVVSGPLGNQKVHFEAPPSSEVDAMMGDLLAWVEDDSVVIDPMVKAAIAHLWFVTIHPFDDGNGRLCRTLTELLLARADDMDMRFYSLSSVLLSRRKDYYEQLEAAQKGPLDVTPWVEWFLLKLKEAITDSLDKTRNVLRKTSFWDHHRDVPLNERQRKVLNMLFDGFVGKLNTSKWYKINHCSQDTALRDINDLIDKGILRSADEGGRSKNYELCDE